MPFYDHVFSGEAPMQPPGRSVEAPEIGTSGLLHSLVDIWGKSTPPVDLEECSIKTAGIRSAGSSVTADGGPNIVFPRQPSSASTDGRRETHSCNLSQAGGRRQ